MSSHMRETIIAHLAELESALGDPAQRRRELSAMCDRLWGEGVDARLVSSHDPIRIHGTLEDGAWFTFHAAGERAELVVFDEDPGSDPDPLQARSVAELREWRGGFAAGFLPVDQVEDTLRRMLDPHRRASGA